MTTRKVDLTVDWVEVGQGSLLLEVRQSQYVQLHYGSAPPAGATGAFHDFFGPQTFLYPGAEKCFARSGFGNTSIIVSNISIAGAGSGTDIDIPIDPVARTVAFLIAGQSNSATTSIWDNGADFPAGVQQLERWQLPISGRLDSGNNTAIPTAGQNLIPATRPIHAHTGVGDGFGFTLQFVIDYGLENPDDEIIIVPCGHGSTGFRDEDNGDPGRWNEGQDLFEDMVARMDRLAQLVPDFELGAVLFHQGERDSNNAVNAAAHSAQVMGFHSEGIDRVPKWTSTTPFIIGGMVPSFVATSVDRQVVQEGLKIIPSQIPYSAYVDPEYPTVLDADGGNGAAHFSPSGYRGMGTRYNGALPRALANTHENLPGGVVPIGEWLLGQDNPDYDAIAGLNLIPKGDITLNEGYASIGQSVETGLDIRFRDRIESTMIAFVRVPNAGNKFIMGNWDANQPRQALFHTTSGFRHNFLNTNGNTDIFGTGVLGDGVFKMVAITRTQTARAFFVGFPGGVEYILEIETINNSISTVNNLAVGPFYANAQNWNAPFDVAKVIYFGSALTQEQLTAVYNSSLTQLADRGVTLGA